MKYIKLTPNNIIKYVNDIVLSAFEQADITGPIFRAPYMTISHGNY